MSTQINVTVDSGGLRQRDRQQRHALRLGKVESDNQRKVEARATDARTAELRNALLGTDGKPLYGIPTPATVRRDEPAAFRQSVKADYYVITYGFTTGRDLDTRTYLRHPETLQLLGPVGWCKDATISVAGKTVITWGGDNTGTGVESVLFDRITYEEAFGQGSKPVLSLNANWYGSLGDKVTIEITGYRGGEMVKDGFAWKNDTANKKWNKFSKLDSTAVTTNQAACIIGDFISYLEIDYTAGKVRYLQSL